MRARAQICTHWCKGKHNGENMAKKYFQKLSKNFQKILDNKILRCYNVGTNKQGQRPKENKMTGRHKEVRKNLAQRNFDYYVWNKKHLSDNDLLSTLYQAGFCKSEAQKSVQFIKNQTIKAYNN